MEVPAEIATESREVATAARGFEITSAEDYSRVGERLTAIKALQKRIAEFFKPHKAAAKAAHDGLCRSEKEELAPLIEAESAYKRAIVLWETEQDRLRRQREAELQAQARKLEEEARLAEAANLEAEGRPELAERVLEAPIDVPAVMIERPKAPAGIAMRSTWKTQVVDLGALVKAVAEGRAPAGLVMANQSALDGMARSLKGAMSVPGVRVVEEKTIAARAGTPSMELNADERPF